MKIEQEDFDESLVALDTYNSDLNLVIDASRYSAHPLTYEGFAFMWAGTRCSHGVSKGKACYEVKVLENKDVSHLPADEPNPHVVRVGFSVESSTLQLGEDPLSYGYGGTGKISTNCQFKDYGASFGPGDVILALVNIDSDSVQIGFAKNNRFLGWAYKISKSELKGQALFPHILTKNVSFEVNFGQKEKPYFPLPDNFKDYTFISCLSLEQRACGTRGPKRREDCKMIMMCGLPGAGKSVWAAEYSKKNPGKKYNVLGTNNIIDKMKVMGLPRKRNYAGRWDVLIQMATKCLNKMFEIGSKLRRNYILDQTNVYPTAQRRKMRNFEGFERIAVVVVPTDAEYKRRCDKRDREEGKEVPDSAVLEMKANFKIPESGDIFKEIIFTELKRKEAEELVALYNEEGRAAVGPPRKQFKPNEQSSRFENKHGFDSAHGNTSSQNAPSRWSSSQGSFDGGRGGHDGGRGGFRGGRGSFGSNRGAFEGNRGGFDGRRGGFDGNRSRFEGNSRGFDRNRDEHDKQQGGFNSGQGGYNDRSNNSHGGYDNSQSGNRDNFERNRGGYDSDRSGNAGGRSGFKGNRESFERGPESFERGRETFERRGFEGERETFERKSFDGGRETFERRDFESGRGGFEGGQGKFESNRGGLEGERGSGGFEGRHGRGGFEGGRVRGSFEGGRGRGGFEGGSARGGFEGGSARGGFEGGSARGGFEGGRGQGSFAGGRGRGGFEGNRGGFSGGHSGYEGGQGGGRDGYASGNVDNYRKRGLDEGSENSEAYGANTFGFGNNSRDYGSRGSSRGRGNFGSSQANDQDNYGNRDFSYRTDSSSGSFPSGKEQALGAYERGDSVGGRGQHGYHGGSSLDDLSQGGSSRGGIVGSRGNNTSARGYGSGPNVGSAVSYGNSSNNRDTLSKFGGGYGGYQSNYNEKSQSGYGNVSDSYTRRDTTSYETAPSGGFKKEPGSETTGYDTGVTTARVRTRPSGRATRWSAETPQTTSFTDRSSTIIQNTNTYSSYTAPVKSEPAVNAGTSRYDNYSGNSSSFATNLPPPTANQGFQGTQAYGYQANVSTNAPSQPWATAQPSPAATQVGKVAQDPQQWPQYYQQQSQPSQYFNQYYGQPPAPYGSLYSAK